MDLLARKVTYLWLIIAFLLGFTLRWFLVSPSSSLNFKFFVHAHSHVALLGWIYGGLYLMLCTAFVPSAALGKFRKLFWIMQIATFGMLVSFPFQGYGLVSITFSTLFLITQYAFAWWMFLILKQEAQHSSMMLRQALLFLIVSSTGPYALGIIMTQGWSSTHWYHNAVYFYLHFLYNGFFLWAVGAWGLRKAEQQNIQLQMTKREIQLLAIAVWLTFALSVLWIRPPWIWYGLGALGAILNLGIVGKLILQNRTLISQAIPVNSLLHWIARFLILLLGVKLITQLISAIPSVASWIHGSQKFTVMGYIHMVMLGMLTPLIAINLFPTFWKNSLFSQAMWIYLCGFLWTEVLLFARGLWPAFGMGGYYYQLLLVGYSVIGVAIVLVGKLVIDCKQ